MAKQAGEARTVGAVCGGVVAVVAAVASYVHMRTLAAKYAAEGEKWLSWITPLSVDGLLVVASLVIVRARRRGEEAPVLAVISVVVGLAVSLAANIGAAPDSITARLINMWPPIAFALAFELVLKLIRPATEQVTEAAPTDAVTPDPAPVGASSAAPGPRAAEDDDAPSRAASAPAAGAAPELHAVLSEGAPDWLREDMSAKEAMFAYLDRSPEATGAELDRFGGRFLNTKPSYGRTVKRQWQKENERSKASGE